MKTAPDADPMNQQFTGTPETTSATSAPNKTNA
jgi:hypothetical protein